MTNLKNDATLQKLKDQSVNNKIAYVRDQTLNLINDLINLNKYNSLLEIGSGIGYSSYVFSKNPNLKEIISIEKDQKRYLLAKDNLKDISKIKLHNLDAISYQNDAKFDFIFLDASKSHQKTLFLKFINNLAPKGTFLIDNIFLKKYLNKTELTKNQKKLMKKVKAFQKYLKSIANNWKIEILNLDDGVAIIQEK